MWAGLVAPAPSPWVPGSPGFLHNASSEWEGLGPDTQAVVIQLSSETEVKYRKEILDKKIKILPLKMSKEILSLFYRNSSVKLKHNCKVLYVTGSVLSATGEF